MMKKVRNRARPISTWLGGRGLRAQAWRSSDSTMMMRVKLVIISMIAGRNDKLVSSSRVWIDSDQLVPPPAAGVLVSAGSRAAAWRCR
jgi:hypothetical protein